MILYTLAETSEAGPSTTGATPDIDQAAHELNPGVVSDVSDRISTGQVVEANRGTGSDVETTASTSAASGNDVSLICSRKAVINAV